MKKILVLAVSLFSLLIGNAQYNKYIVRFSDKLQNDFSLDAPQTFLSNRAIERRNRYPISIDSSDLPISGAYIDSIRLAGNVTILNTSKWLNQVSIETYDPTAITRIIHFPFVVKAKAVAPRLSEHSIPKHSGSQLFNIPTQVQKTNSSELLDYGLSANQIKIHQGEFLHNHGFKGTDIQIAVIDDGFYHYDALPTFDSILHNQQVLGTWDFVSKDSSVNEDDKHGMYCLSTIAANIPGVFVGTAPKTNFYLFRTEDVNSEYPIEEHNLACAAEKADSLGVDICSISLGYNTFDDPAFDYSYIDMNGNTSNSAKAVDIAASKGMLMVVAAGNEGNQDWHYINTPADADSCLSVGAVDSNGYVAYFSSYGPSSDGQVKPSVAAIGWNAVVANEFDGLPIFSNGTSFACPIIAGLSSCLWQAFPEASNMDIIKVLESSSSNANNSNDSIGFGIPNAKKAFVILQKKFFRNEILPIDCNIAINLTAKMDTTMRLLVERKFPTDSAYSTITTFHSEENYKNQRFTYLDEISIFDYSNVKYRYLMVIGRDTSYYVDSAEIILFTPCNVDTISNNQIKIYPNPFSSILNIDIENNEEYLYSFSISNESGQKLLHSSYKHNKGRASHTINTNTLSKGIYFITVYINGRKDHTRKLIKL